MSEPTRYSVEEIECCFQADMVEDSNGEYVRWEDYARLKAEVESLYRHGDLMLKFAAANMTFPAYATMAKDWNAAKEGKPHA